MRRLLLVSYCFPPILTAEAINLTRTVRALEDLGWRSTVLTVDPRSVVGERDDALLARLPPAIEIRTAPSPRQPLHILKRAPLRVLLQFGLPEEQFVWYPQALALGRRILSRERFDAMLSWASFHTSNVVGLGLKRGTSIGWVAHSSDPWTRSPYFPRRQLQRVTAARLERAIFKTADALTFTTSETVDLVMNGMPAPWRAKARVVPHGYEVSVPEPLRPRGGPLRLVHTGQFYKGKRTPLPLLEALATLDRAAPLRGRVQMLFVGPTIPEYVHAAERLGLGGVVRFVGPQSAAKAQEHAREADVLIVIDAPSDGPSVFLPSKVVEYLSLGKPILGITPAVGATASLLSRGACPIAPPDDPKAIAGTIRGLIDRYEAAGNAPLEISSALAEVAREYEIHRTTERLVNVLDSVSSASR